MKQVILQLEPKIKEEIRNKGTNLQELHIKTEMKIQELIIKTEPKIKE